MGRSYLFKFQKSICKIYYTHAPCTYLPTFGLNLWYMVVHVGKCSIRGASGICKTRSLQTWTFLWPKDSSKIHDPYHPRMVYSATFGGCLLYIRQIPYMDAMGDVSFLCCGFNVQKNSSLFEEDSHFDYISTGLVQPPNCPPRSGIITAQHSDPSGRSTSSLGCIGFGGDPKQKRLPSQHGNLQPFIFWGGYFHPYSYGTL